MRVFLVLMMILFGVGVASAETTKANDDAGSRTIRVMSYNILVGIGPVPDRSKGANDPTENLARIADYIASENADIVLLQEVDNRNGRTQRVEEPRMLAERLGYHHVYGAAYNKDDGSQYGIAILSRWPIESHEVVKLYKPDYSQSHPQYPDYYSEQRVAVFARITSPFGVLNVVDTHLGLTTDQRTKQLEAIAGRIRELNGPVIFGGDLNAEPDARELIPIRLLLKDSYQSVVNKRGEERSIPIAERLTFPYDVPRVCIDYIFVSESDFEVLETKVPDIRLSDHRPVVTELEVKE